MLSTHVLLFFSFSFLSFFFFFFFFLSKTSQTFLINKFISFSLNVCHTLSFPKDDCPQFCPKPMRVQEFDVRDIPKNSVLLLIYFDWYVFHGRSATAKSKGK